MLAAAKAASPGTRQEYWIPKLTRNVERDKQSRMELKRLGWRVLTIWECELTNPAKVQSKLRTFLN